MQRRPSLHWLRMMVAGILTAPSAMYLLLNYSTLTPVTAFVILVGVCAGAGHVLLSAVLLAVDARNARRTRV